MSTITSKSGIWAKRITAKWQLAIQFWFAMHAEEWNVLVRPELRIRTGATRYRIGDVTTLDAAMPRERIPTRPPLIVFEVLSPEARLSRVKVRLADFAAMGVAEIWLVDPANGNFDRFEDGQLVRRERFDFAARGMSFPVAEIANLVRKQIGCPTSRF